MTSQKPPKQNFDWHSAELVHPAPTGLPVAGVVVPPSAGGGGGAPQTPFTHAPLQQSAQLVAHDALPPHPGQGEPLGMHAGVHFLVVASHFLLQQSASVAHVAVRPRHALGGKVQRGGSKFDLSQRSFVAVARQQPL